MSEPRRFLEESTEEEIQQELQRRRKEALRHYASEDLEAELARRPRGPQDQPPKLVEK